MTLLPDLWRESTVFHRSLSLEKGRGAEMLWSSYLLVVFGLALSLDCVTPLVFINLGNKEGSLASNYNIHHRGRHQIAERKLMSKHATVCLGDSLESTKSHSMQSPFVQLPCAVRVFSSDQYYCPVPPCFTDRTWISHFLKRDVFCDTYGVGTQ